MPAEWNPGRTLYRHRLLQEYTVALMWMYVVRQCTVYLRVADLVVVSVVLLERGAGSAPDSTHGCLI